MKRKYKKKIIKSIFYLMCFLLFAITNNLNIFNEYTKENNIEQKEETINNELSSSISDDTSLLNVHYIDVGQGDSIFIELPNNLTMLIDGGENDMGKVVIDYISKLGYSKIDYVIGSHPHSDHIGGLIDIVNFFEIKKIYMPKALSTSKTYENLLNSIAEKNLKIYTAKTGLNIINDSNLLVDIIAPNSDSYEDLNNYSVILKLTYKNKSFLFTGDAEILSENEITRDVSADVIKVGHHGSNTSSSQSFINKVGAKYAIISVGKDNSYDHPHQVVLDRFKNSGAQIYRTDLNGTIIVTTDGNNIKINALK